MADDAPDEKHVYALVSTVNTNIHRLRQGIDGLRQIHNRWTGKDGASINLIAQLTALKSNLSKMRDWLNYAIDDMHPQLLSDLDILMASCVLLVRHLDNLIQRLRQPDHDAVDCAIKLKYAVGSRSMEKLRTVAKSQNDAVGLLLAACKCHASAQRKILLHKSRQIKKEHTSSLKTLARSSRWNGGCIMILTQASRIIQGLRLLFLQKLSQTDLESLPSGEDYEASAAAIRSQAIDRALQQEAVAMRRETKLVLLGHSNSGKELIMHQMRVLYADGYFPSAERVTYRPAVRSNIRLLIHAIIDLLKDTGIALPAHLNRHFAVLLHEVETVNLSRITPEAVTAVTALWTAPVFTTLYLRNFEIDFPQYASYFASAAPRIAQASYIPTEADIIRLPHAPNGIKELRFSWDELDVRIFNVSEHIPAPFRKRWFHQLEDATGLIYTLDVSQYDRPYFGQPGSSALLADLAQFDAWANAPRFANSAVILLLNNFSRFKEKLEVTPLQSVFPDYVPQATYPVPSAPHTRTATPATAVTRTTTSALTTFTSPTSLTSPSITSAPSTTATPYPSSTTSTTPANAASDPNDPSTAARQYILHRFRALNRNALSIYSFWVDLDDSDNTHLYAALKKTLFHIQQRRARHEVAVAEKGEGGLGGVGGWGMVGGRGKEGKVGLGLGLKMHRRELSRKTTDASGTTEGLSPIDEKGGV